MLTFRTDLPEERYKDPAKSIGFYDQLLERLRAIPGVKSASITSQLPLTRNMSGSFSIQGKTFHTSPYAHVGLIGPDYFATVQTPLLSGRTLTDADTGKGTLQVAMIDDNVAKAYFPNQDPVGQKLMFTFEGTEKEPVWRTIVGVVHSVKTPTRSRTKAKGRSFFPSSRYLCSL